MKILSRVGIEANPAVYNAAVRFLNKLVLYPRQQGLPLIDGGIECPKCHRTVPTYADPQEWTKRRQPIWRRDDGRAWAVESYWGGTAQCCGLLLAFQPDGHAEAYDLSESD